MKINRQPVDRGNETLGPLFPWLKRVARKISQSIAERSKPKPIDSWVTPQTLSLCQLA